MSLSEVLTKIDQVASYKLFEFNQTPVTPASLVMFAVIIVVFYFIARIIRRLLTGKILPRFEIDRGVQFMLTRLTHYLVMIVGFVVAFQFVGIDLSGLAVVFGLLSVGIGFGLQNVTSNFISGLILLFERPIQVGDRVTVGDTEGDVVSINMRSTTIRSLDNISIIVPNSEFISSTVINWSHGDPKIIISVNVGVSYTSDLDVVLKTLKEIGAGHPDVLKNPEPVVFLRNFGDSSWDMRLRVCIDSPKKYHKTLSEINCAIVQKFRERGVEIPYPQRDLHVRSPLPVPLLSEVQS